jgi:hypothetical protein
MSKAYLREGLSPITAQDSGRLQASQQYLHIQGPYRHSRRILFADKNLQTTAGLARLAYLTALFVTTALPKWVPIKHFVKQFTWAP